MGEGIALPHGRIEGISRPRIAIATLAEPVDYEAPDGLPVWFAACLIVPVDANETHLRLLAALATCLRDSAFVGKVRDASTAQALYQLFREIGVPH